MTRPPTTRWILAGAVVAAAATGCSSSSGSGYASAGTSQPASSPGTSLVSARTPLGDVLVTGSGRTVYVLRSSDKDVPCAGPCAAVWPPVRNSGSQVTVAGHPVYTFTGDTAAGQVNGQGARSFGGTWQALAPNGAPVPVGTGGGAAGGSSSAPSSSASSSAGGGYVNGY